MALLMSFLSGAAGLTYEVLWARWLAIGLGGTAEAQALVLASFLGGLAAGGAWLGPKADRAENPLRFFARLEFSAAAWGLLSPFLLRALAAWTSGPYAVRAALGAALVFLPCVVLGGALPALVRASGAWKRELAPLYAANCLGAAFGAFAAGFVLIPALGLVGAVHMAAGFNFVGGALAWGLSSASSPQARKPEPAQAETAGLSPAAALSCAFVAGAASIACETAWTRVFALAMGSSTYSFSAMLSGFILGTAAGGLALSGGPLSRRAPGPLLGACLAASGAAWLASPFWAQRLPYWFEHLQGLFPRAPWAFYPLEASKLLLCACALLVPAALLAMVLPLAGRLAGEEAGKSVGGGFAFNCAGCALGAWAGLLLLPALGADGLIRACGLACLLAGAGALASCGRARTGAAALAAGVLLWGFGPRLDKLYFSIGGFRDPLSSAASAFAHRYVATRKRELLFYKDDREATVAVVRNTEGVRTLKVNGKADASSGGDMETQVLLAELPMILKPDASEVLVVGWGSGVTVGSIMRHPVSLVDAVEIVPAVVEASEAFAAENGAAVRDPRLRLFLEDARGFIRRPIQDYDLIVSEPSNPWMAGVGGLYTDEFYRAAAARLKPGGLMVQWLHLYETDDETFSLILRTFAARFAHVTAWSIGGIDVLLVGSAEPPPADFLAMHRAYERPGVAEDLVRARIYSLPALLSLQAAGDATVRELAGKGELNREERPLLEYRAPKAFFLDGYSYALLDRHDARDPARGKELLLERYWAGRPFKPTGPEYKSLALPRRGKRERFRTEAWLAEWKKRHPRDPDLAVIEKIFAER